MPGRGVYMLFLVSQILELILPSILTLSWKIYTPKYNGKIKEGLSSKKYNTSLRFVFMVFFKRETEVGASWGINYYITYNSICTTQLLIGILNAPSKKEFYDLLVWPSSLP